MTDIVGQGIVRDRRARLKLPSSQDAVSVLVLVFCGVLVLYPMVYLVVLSVNVGDPQTFPPDEYGIEHYRDLFESWRVIANTAFVACIATVMAILIGFLVAWTLTRTQLPGAAWLERLMQLPYYMTPLVGALAWSILAAPRTGFLNQLWHTVGGSGRSVQRLFALGHRLGHGAVRGHRRVRDDLGGDEVDGPGARRERAGARRRQMAGDADRDPAAGYAGRGSAPPSLSLPRCSVRSPPPSCSAFRPALS